MHHGANPGFDNSGPQPYGDKSFDAYGVADTSFWYPREIPGFSCQQGLRLDDVIARFKSSGGLDGPSYFRLGLAPAPHTVMVKTAAGDWRAYPELA
jgi:hypothetical protein